MQFRDHPARQPGKRDFYFVDPQQLKIEPDYNVRDLSTPDAMDRLDELKRSIIANGVRVPLEVRLDGDDIFIVAGHRRHAATMLAISEGHDIKAIPVIPEPKGRNDAERTLDLVVSNSGEPLAPLEMAEVVRRLLAFGWPEAQIAQRLGWKSIGTVKHYVDMLEMPAEVQGMVKRNEVSATTAVKEVRKNGATAAVETLREAKTIATEAGKTKVTDKSVKAVTQQRKPRQMPMPLPANRNGIEALIKALEPFAKVAEFTDLNERQDDDVIEVRAGDLKRAARVFAQATGGES